jgi:hypothetical protein
LNFDLTSQLKNLIKLKSPNIYLTQFVDYCNIRIDNMLMLMDIHHDIGNIYSYSNFILNLKEHSKISDDSILLKKSPKKYGVEWNNRVDILVSLFTQRAPSSLFQFFFQSQEKNNFFEMEMFCEAVVKRIMHLMQEKETTDDFTLKGKWMIFSDMIYSLLEHQG